MRFDRVAVNGFGTIEGAEVDFETLGGPIVAVCGPNGAGKSTLLELLAGAVYRSTPTRGTLADLASRRDATLEVRVAAPRPMVLRHAVDSQNGKAEAVVANGDGCPLTPTGKVRDYDAWVREHLPPADVVMASMFAAQADGGFIAMKPGDRKAVLLRALGIERLEALAERARAEARVARGVAATHEEVATRTAGATGARQAAADRLASLRTLDADVEARLTATREAASAAASAMAEWRARSEAYAAAQRRTAELARALVEAEARRGDAATRLTNNQALLARADEVREAVARAAALRADREAAAAKAASLRTDAERCGAAATESERAFNAADTRAVGARLRADRIRTQLASMGDGSDTREALAFAEGLVQDRTAELAAAEAALEAVRNERMTDAAGRIAHLRAGLERIEIAPFGRCRELATQTLRADNETEAAARSAPERHGRAEGTVQDRRRGLALAQRALSEAQRAHAAYEGRGALLDAQLAEDAAADAARTEADRTAHEARTLRRQERGARAALLSVDEALGAIDRELSGLADTLAMAPRLESAAARIAELEPVVAEFERRIGELRTERENLLAAAPVGPAPDSATATRHLAEAEAAARDHDRAVMAAIEALKTADANVTAHAEAAERLAEARTTAEDWARLAADLGRDGLQALEIDGAGPELTAIVNDLLGACHGPRFTVTIEATRPSADGKRTLEGCEVRVLDTVGGREGAAETFSGGERVILGEAIALALSALACRRHGLEGVTLIRDETGAALDEEAGRAYVAMLRRGAEAMGASRVLFVTHNPELAAMADARLEVGDGTVRVVEL
jgi:exonuclease SbcC